MLGAFIGILTARTRLTRRCSQKKVHYNSVYRGCLLRLLRLVQQAFLRHGRDPQLRAACGQVLQACPSVTVGHIGLARNEIPPPYGE